MRTARDNRTEFVACRRAAEGGPRAVNIPVCRALPVNKRRAGALVRRVDGDCQAPLVDGRRALSQSAERRVDSLGSRVWVGVTLARVSDGRCELLCWLRFAARPSR